MNEIKAQVLLGKCVGDEIWSLEKCELEGIPKQWLEELQGAFESGFDHDRNTIYVENKMTNQYHGVLDLQIAYKCAEFLGIDWRTATQSALGRRAEVRALKEAFEEM